MFGPYVGGSVAKWGAQTGAPKVDGGGEVSYWHHWNRLPVKFGIDFGVGTRGTYTELQIAPSEIWIVGLSAGLGHVWKDHAGLVGIQATAWLALAFVVPYLRIEEYGPGRGLQTAGAMIKFPIIYTGPVE